MTAKAWAVFDADSGELISGRNEHEQREVASITKIMTCWVSLQLARKFCLDLNGTYFIVPQEVHQSL